MSIFSTRLKELRNKANLSQQELSKVIGISKSSINMYERGEREPGLETVRAFADFFDVQTDYLLGNHDDKRSLKEGKKYNRLIIQTVDNYRQLHGYEREQMEMLLDWEGMYSDLEKDRTIGDEGVLKIIQNKLDILDSPSLEKNKPSPDKADLTEGEQMWLELYNRLSDDMRELLIKTMDSFDRLPEDKQKLALQMIRVALGDRE